MTRRSIWVNFITPWWNLWYWIHATYRNNQATRLKWDHISTAANLHPYPRWNNLSWNWVTSHKPYPVKAPIRSSCATIRIIWMWCDHSYLDLVVHRMLMVLSCTTSTSRMITLHVPLNVSWRRLVMGRSASTQTYTIAVRFAWVCWVHGATIGSPTCRHCCRSSSRSNPWWWASMCTSMNRVGSTPWVHLKVIHVIVGTATSSSWPTFGTPWSRLSATLLKASRMSSCEASTYAKISSWRSYVHGSMRLIYRVIIVAHRIITSHNPFNRIPVSTNPFSNPKWLNWRRNSINSNWRYKAPSR